MADKYKCIKELVLSYNDNCSAAEDAALKFLGTDIGQDHMPVVNVPTLRDLVKGDFWILLRRGKETFCNPVENALFLVALTDYVTCAVRNVQLFDIFLKKKDLTNGIPSLLTYIDSHWNRLFCLLSTPQDMSADQLRSLVSLFKKSINRLPTKIQRDCFNQALNAGERQLYCADMVCRAASKMEKLSSVHSTLIHRQKQSEDDHLSYTSIKNCETPKYELDISLKGRYLSLTEERFESKHKSVKIKKISDVVMDIPERILTVSPKDIHVKKKPKYSSDITKYICTVEKKDPIITNSHRTGIKKHILEVTSKENVQALCLDKRSITPPFSVVSDDPVKGSLDTPPDQPVVINLCSPTKKMPVGDAAQLTVSANGKKNAFAIMMQRSKENSKRKALFPSGRGAKV